MQLLLDFPQVKISLHPRIVSTRSIIAGSELVVKNRVILLEERSVIKSPPALGNAGGRVPNSDRSIGVDSNNTLRMVR